MATVTADGGNRDGTQAGRQSQSLQQQDLPPPLLLHTQLVAPTAWESMQAQEGWGSAMPLNGPPSHGLVHGAELEHAGAAPPPAVPWLLLVDGLLSQAGCTLLQVPRTVTPT